MSAYTDLDLRPQFVLVVDVPTGGIAVLAKDWVWQPLDVARVVGVRPLNFGSACTAIREYVQKYPHLPRPRLLHAKTVGL